MSKKPKPQAKEFNLQEAAKKAFQQMEDLTRQIAALKKSQEKEGISAMENIDSKARMANRWPLKTA